MFLTIFWRSRIAGAQSLVYLALLTVSLSEVATAQEPTAVRLSLGRPVAGNIKMGENQYYQVVAQGGEFLHVWVRQRGIVR